MNNAVNLEGVSKNYGPVAALRELSLQIPQGEVLGLLGHNGAGKTTTIKLILGVIKPTSGKVEVLGHAPSTRSGQSLRMQWGYLPESVSFYEQLTGREVLEYFARLKRVTTQQRDALLERVGLVDAADRRVKTYSKGMRQRLGLAQALLGRPRLLLLDEPTVGLDPIAVRDFFSMLDELSQQGTTVILSSHVLPGIEQHIHRVAIMRRGNLRAVGTLDELRQQARLPLKIRARGQWPKNFWEPQLDEQGFAPYRVNCTSLEVESPLDAKLDVMRLLLADNRVQDLEVQSPSLESLYVHFNASSPRGADHA
ncbi:MAG: ABC transporter ATP-binding protein [Thioalkalispiraceae bacterium]|jgi:Cu-processing system ATP-binding protein